VTLAPAKPRTCGEETKPTLEPEPLLSDEAIAAVGSAFHTLKESVRKHEPPLEDLVRETLRPMLQSWLDDNLPGVVEQMVRAEIERAIPRR
jgi:cell pole-organizing protein PopZ